MQFIDLQHQYQRIQEGVNRRIQHVLEHGRYIMGPEIVELETKLAEYVGVKHAVALSSGTDAILLSLRILDVGPGDEVITTPFSFFSTAGMIKLLGATPVFVDIEPQTYNIDPALIEAKITERTKAILVVNLFGQCVDFDAIQHIADKYQLPIIEDAAQSFGATYGERQSGSLGTIACASFFPSKPLGSYGDSGACFTNDDAIATRLRQLRDHGQVSRYEHMYLGINARMDSMQAAVLLEKLTIFPDELQARRLVANNYAEMLINTPIKPPYIAPYGTSVFAQYTIEVDDRDGLQAYMKQHDIPTAVHYPLPIYLQPVFSDLGLQPGECPVTERAAGRVISLPMCPYLQPQQQQQVVDVLRQYVES